MDSLPTMDDLDSEPTIKELSNAIADMALWKAPGSDGIPTDLQHHWNSVLKHDITVIY